ncbi:Uncharacterised protein [Segatella copri]|nr:Uncharacterised protein [Segatella copri]
MMLTEIALILGCEVHLIVISTNHGTSQIVTIGGCHTIEVRRCQVIEICIIAAGRSIKVVTATITSQHLIEGEV